MSDNRFHLIALLAGVHVFSLGCGEDSSNGDDVAAELAAYEEQADGRARDVCRAPENVDELESSDSDEAACYFELSVGFEPCIRQALEAHPEIARELITCDREQREVLIACCEAEGPCTYASIEHCYSDAVERGEPRACDDLDLQPVRDSTATCKDGGD